MSKKNDKKPSHKVKRSINWLRPTTPAKKMLIFVLLFALIGGGYYTYKSFAATPIKTEHIGYEVKRNPLTIGKASASGGVSGSLNATSTGYCYRPQFCYFYANTYQGNINASGVSADISIHKPALVYDYHTLAEIAVSSVSGQTIEIGWTVDQNLNGDTQPHLFVYSWINNNETCYNGCFFVPVASPYHAGMTLPVGVVANFKILHDATTHRWNLSMNGSVFGYYPDAEWGNTYTTGQEVQIFGEVSSGPTTTPLSDMGSGNLGGATGSATVRNITYYGAGSAIPNPQILVHDYPNMYQVGYVNGQTMTNGFNFGGPGAKSVPPTGRVDVFNTGGISSSPNTNQLIHTASSNDLWSGYEDLGSPAGATLSSGPTVTSRGSGRLDVFAKDSNNHLVHKWFEGGRWSGWETFTDGTIASDPDAVSSAPGRIDIVARSSTNKLMYKIYDGTWHPWVTFADGSILSSPTITTWGPGRYDVFARGTDNHVYQKFYNRDGGGWSGWLPMGGATGDSPDAVSWFPGRIDLFVRGTDNQLWHKWYQAGWSGWESLGGTLTSGPSAASRGVGRLDVFVRGTDNAMYQKWYDAGGWHGYISLGGNLTSAPDAVSWH